MQSAGSAHQTWLASSCISSWQSHWTLDCRLEQQNHNSKINVHVHLDCTCTSSYTTTYSGASLNDTPQQWTPTIYWTILNVPTIASAYPFLPVYNKRKLWKHSRVLNILITQYNMATGNIPEAPELVAVKEKSFDPNGVCHRRVPLSVAAQFLLRNSYWSSFLIHHAL